MTRRKQQQVALITTVSLFFILTCVTWVFDPIFHMIDMELSSFRLGVGLLILLTSLTMVKAVDNAYAFNIKDVTENVSLRSAFVPLSTPFIVAPAVLGLVMLYAHDFNTTSDHMTMTYVSLGIALGIGLLMFIARFLANHLGKLGIRFGIRFVGLFLLAVGIELMVKALYELFPFIDMYFQKVVSS